MSLLANLSPLLDARLKGDPKIHVLSSTQENAWRELVHFAESRRFSSSMDEIVEWGIAIQVWIIGYTYEIESFQEEAMNYMSGNFCVHGDRPRGQAGVHGDCSRL